MHIYCQFYITTVIQWQHCKTITTITPKMPKDNNCDCDKVFNRHFVLILFLCFGTIPLMTSMGNIKAMTIYLFWIMLWLFWMSLVFLIFPNHTDGHTWPQFYLSYNYIVTVCYLGWDTLVSPECRLLLSSS